MKSFEYTIKEPVGLHARPAGMLNKEARKYKSAIIIHAGAKSANVLRLMAVMQEAQDIYGYLPIEVQTIIAEEMCE